jgi:N-acetylglucosamine-6-phosphate deacetylase
MLKIDAFTDVRIITEDTVIPKGWLIIRDGLIDSYGEGEYKGKEAKLIIKAEGMTLTAGYIDIHVHGGNGYEAMDASYDSLNELSLFYGRHGVTGFLPTTWTADGEPILNALEAIAQHQKSVTGAQILGAHVEGPYINPTKPGAQAPHLIRPADMDEFAKWEQTGVIKLVTIAPEFPENEQLLKHCVANGIAVTAGHTDATYAQMERAVALGLGATTHTFNAMRPLHHREAGTVGAALSIDSLYCEVIADGVHVSPPVVNLLYKAKGADKLMLITDAVRGAGLPEGTTYLQDGRTVTVKESAYLDDGTLAGSTLTLDQAVKNLAQFTGRDITEIWRCASLTPAQWIGVDDVTGSIKVGKRADLVLLDADLNVRTTLVKGYTIPE